MAIILDTVAKVITEVRSRFAEIAPSTWITDTNIIAWINQGQYDIVFRAMPPSHEVETPNSTNSVAGTYSYALPNDFFRISEVEGDQGGVFYAGVGLKHEAKRIVLEDGIENGFNQADPEFYWLWAKKVFVWPVPNRVKAIRLYYYRLPVDVAITTDNIDLDMPWREIVVKFILWKSLEKDKHNMAQVYHQEYEQALSTMFSENRVRIEKRARYVHARDQQ